MSVDRCRYDGDINNKDGGLRRCSRVLFPSIPDHIVVFCHWMKVGLPHDEKTMRDTTPSILDYTLLTEGGLGGLEFVLAEQNRYN